MFGPPGLYSALYKNSECRVLFSAVLVYIKHYIQTPNVELYFRPSLSIFSTIFKLRMYSSIFGSNIQQPKLELYFRSSRSTYIFSTTFKLRRSVTILISGKVPHSRVIFCCTLHPRDLYYGKLLVRPSSVTKQ